MLLFSSFLSNGQNTFPTTGNTGIGTTNPQNSLEIVETSKTNGNLKLSTGKVILGNSNDFIYNGEYRSKIISDGGLYINSTHPYIHIHSSSNDVKARSHAVIATAVGDTFFSNVSKMGDIVFKMQTSNGQYGGYLIFANEIKNKNNGFKFTTTAPNETYASTKLIITNNGNVGIGTETPDAKLAVNGDIHSKEVRIDLNNWPDYVFDQNYNLPTIAQTEQHIKEKGRLINMPSAETIETKGLELGEITRLQQEKIEELTLYIIELNKRIERLEKSNNQKQ